MIPKKLHAIWVGRNHFSISYYGSMLRIALLAASQGYETFLWTDNPSARSKEFFSYFSGLSFQQTTEDSIPITIKDINEIFEEKTEMPQALQKPLDLAYWYARVGRSNLSECTDYLRIRILFDHGGIYFDCDTQTIFPIFPLKDEYASEPDFFTLAAKHGFLIAGLEKNEEDNDSTDKFLCNTALIASTPSNPILLEAAKIMVNHLMSDKPYTEYKDTSIRLTRVMLDQHGIFNQKRNFKSKDRKQLTLNLSGPGVYIELIKNLLKQKKIDLSDIFFPMDEQFATKFLGLIHQGDNTWVRPKQSKGERSYSLGW